MENKEMVLRKLDWVDQHVEAKGPVLAHSLGKRGGKSAGWRSPREISGPALPWLLSERSHGAG